MPIIYTYPSIVPKISDLVLLSATNSDDQNITANATLSSIKDVIDVVDTFSSSFGTYISGATNTNATGAVNIGTLNLSAIDGTAVIDTRFLSKDNTWDVPAFVTSVTAFTTSDFGKEGIVTTPTTGAVKVGIDILPLTDLSTGALGSDLLFVVDDPSGIPKNKKISIDNFFSTVGLITNSSINYTVKLPNTVGTANQVLKLPSEIGTTPYQLTWGDASAGGVTSTANGGTGISISSPSLHNILVGNGGSAYGESKDVETGIQLSVGATNRRPSAVAANVGLIRYNSQTTNFEVCKETSAASDEYSWYIISGLTIITE